MKGSKYKTRLRYDGELLQEHKIDIRTLSLSFIALDNLLKNASNVIYNDNRGISIQVKNDIEQNCFEVLLQLEWNSIVDYTTDLLRSDKTNDLKNILEWLGILGGVVGTTGYSVFYLCKKFKGEKIRDEDIINKDNNYITIKGNISITSEVYNIYNNDKVRRSIGEFIQPLKEDGISTIDFITDDNNTTTLDKNDYCDYDPFQNEDRIATNIITTFLKVYRPELEEKSKYWIFLHNGKQIKVDISSTNLAKDTVSNGVLKINNAYKVKLEVEEKLSNGGRILYSYRLIEVLRPLHKKHRTFF